MRGAISEGTTQDPMLMATIPVQNEDQAMLFLDDFLAVNFTCQNSINLVLPNLHTFYVKSHCGGKRAMTFFLLVKNIYYEYS